MMHDLRIGILELFVEQGRWSRLPNEVGDDGRATLRARSGWTVDKLPPVNTEEERASYAAALRREAARRPLARRLRRTERETYREALERLKTSRKLRTRIKLSAIERERRCRRCNALLSLQTKGLKKVYCTAKCRKADAENRRPKRYFYVH